MRIKDFIFISFFLDTGLYVVVKAPSGRVNMSLDQEASVVFLAKES